MNLNSVSIGLNGYIVDNAVFKDIGDWTITIVSPFRDIFIKRGTEELQNIDNSFPTDEKSGRALSK